MASRDRPDGPPPWNCRPGSENQWLHSLSAWLDLETDEISELVGLKLANSIDRALGPHLHTHLTSVPPDDERRKDRGYQRTGNRTR